MEVYFKGQFPLCQMWSFLKIQLVIVPDKSTPLMEDETKIDNSILFPVKSIYISLIFFFGFEKIDQNKPETTN